MKKTVQRLRDALGSSLTIFTYPDERRPVPRAKNGKKSKPGELKLACSREESIEIGQVIVEAIAYALYRVERNGAHGGEARNGSGFHVDERGAIC